MHIYTTENNGNYSEVNGRFACADFRTSSSRGAYIYYSDTFLTINHDIFYKVIRLIKYYAIKYGYIYRRNHYYG